jgi:uncharacterized protein YlxW (UPF0749 family)
MKKISLVLLLSFITFLTANNEIKQDVKEKVEKVEIVHKDTIIKKKENNLKAEIEKLKKILLADERKN